MRVRVENIPRTTCNGQASVGLLFSGGIDCMVLAALADKFLPPDHTLDLINVAFVGENLFVLKTQNLRHLEIVVIDAFR